MVMLLMGTDLLSGSVQPIMGPQHLFIDIEAQGLFSRGYTGSATCRNTGYPLLRCPSVATGPLGHIGSPDDPGSMNFASPEGAGDTVNDPSSDEEAASTDDESDPEDPTVAWCPPIPDAAEDPSEDEIASAADKLAILITNVQPNGNPFCMPENLGVLPQLWLQARLTLSLTAIQEKFSRILLSVACELWLRGQSATMIEDVLLQTARALTIRLAESSPKR